MVRRNCVHNIWCKYVLSVSHLSYLLIVFPEEEGVKKWKSLWGQKYIVDNFCFFVSHFCRFVVLWGQKIIEVSSLLITTTTEVLVRIFLSVCVKRFLVFNNFISTA